MQAKAGATEGRDGWKKIEGAVYEQVPGTVCPGICSAMFIWPAPDAAIKSGRKTRSYTNPPPPLT